MYTFRGFTTGGFPDKQVTILLIGNDIVDLHVRELVHPRFARRVLSNDEYLRYEKSGRREEVLWQAWAAKEAAYKLEKQRDSNIFFSPAAFAFDDRTSCVSYGGRIVPVTFESANGYVFCYCSEGEGRVENFISHAPEDRHTSAVRDLARQKIAERLGFKLTDIAIQTDEYRIPRVVGPGGLLPCVVSFSHHGSWIAVSIGFQPGAG